MARKRVKQNLEYENKVSLTSSLRNRLWLILNMTFTIIYLVWRGFFTLPFGYGMVSITIGIALYVVELFGALEALIHYWSMNKVENYKVPNVPESELPDVDVYVVTYSEPVDLLYKTLNGCINMDYPDKSKVHIHLCDDGGREEMRQLAEKMGVNYFAREDHKGAKAGNLNYALERTSAPILVVFDSDMIPRHEFLLRTVPYFVDAEIKNRGRKEEDKIRVGFVQTPQSFYNPDLFQFWLYSETSIPNEQDYFYRDVQIARNKSNSVIFVVSNTVLSREAVLEVGGFYTKSITEDFATGILMEKAGFNCYGVNEVLASGLSPDDLKSLIKQRNRWARGVISSVRSLNIFFTNELSLAQKMNYWASIWYWYVPIKRLIYILSPILFAVFGYTVIKCNLLQVMIFWLPMYISSDVCLKMLSRNIRNSKWTAIYETVLFPFMLGPVILETFCITLKKFNVTNKNRESTKNDVVYSLPFLLLIILSVIGIINCVTIMLASNTVGTIVVLFWLISNLYSLMMSYLFVLGRKFFRKSERIQLSMPCKLINHNVEYECKTLDLSEGGVSVLFKGAVDIDYNDKVDIVLKTERYSAKVICSIVHVIKVEDGWKYAFKIEGYYDTFDDYLQILYDRIPIMPQNLSNSRSFFDDIFTNITIRLNANSSSKRKSPRVEINSTVYDTESRKYEMVDFNLRYVTMKNKSDKIVNLVLSENLIIKCSIAGMVSGGVYLYEIVNYEDIRSNTAKRAELENWLLEHEIKRKKLEDYKKSMQVDFNEMDFV